MSATSNRTPAMLLITTIVYSASSPTPNDDEFKRFLPMQQMGDV